MLHVSEAEVKRLLTFPRAIQLAREAYEKLARGEAVSPQRIWLEVPSGATMFFMPAHILGQRTTSVKIARVNSSNPERSLPTVMLTVYVYDSHTGEEIGQIEGETLTAVRTAASTAVATDLLARNDAEVLGVCGTGIEAESHIAAIAEVRKLDRTIVYSRTKERREVFARRISSTYGIKTMPAESPEEVVETSDILVTATTSQTPLFKGELVRTGSHVNAIGAAVPGSREVDTSLVKRSMVVVDSREQAISTYGDIIIPIREGAIKESHIRAELGELITRQKTIARGPGDITLFKSGGLAVLDAAVADFIISHLPQRLDE